MAYVAGIDLGGTAINYTIADQTGRFLIGGLCELPSRTSDGPEVCLDQIAEGLARAATLAGVPMEQISAIGLDTPGPSTPDGVLSARGSTNFPGREWQRFDVRSAVATRLGRPVAYINDGNAAALWGHQVVFGGTRPRSSITTVIGTGLGGGIVIDGRVISGARGFGGELGHVLVPYERIEGTEGLRPRCNCGREGDLESVCSLTAIRQSLLPHFIAQHPEHDLARLNNIQEAALLVRGYAQAGDAMCRDIFRVQARALGLFFDQMINVFDPDALIVGGGAVEASPDFQEWFLGEVRAAMPLQRSEQATLPIHIMPNGDCAGARGAALEALRVFR